MRELTMTEIDFVSGAAPGNEITSDEAMALAAYYGALGSLLTVTGVGAGFGGVCFALSAGFAAYSMM